MRRIGFLSLSFAATLALAGCGAERPGHYDTASAPLTTAEPAPAQRAAAAPPASAGYAMPTGGGAGGAADTTADVSLDQASKAQTSAEAAGRKIIRNAELTIEVEKPADAQQKIGAVAERLGGFVVTSEISQASSSSATVSIVMRVPADRFGDALAALHEAGSRVLREKTTGQDVTEEYVDLEARLRAKQALEAQFLEIMKQAHSVDDALNVQRQLGQVRGEIEQIEGRKRFLENQSSLSTITVTLQAPTPIVEATTEGFGYHLRRAFGDGVDTASSIVIGVIRLLGVGIPVFLMIVLPVGLVLRWLWKRMMRGGTPSAPGA